MNDRARAASSPGLSGPILAAIESRASARENELVAPWRKELAAFLDHPDAATDSRCLLDIGLENRLVLKFNVIATRRDSPFGLIHDLGERESALAAVAEFVLRHRLRCHAGVKLSESGIEYELYPYQYPEHSIVAALFPEVSGETTLLPAPPYCLGVSSTGSLSAYAEIPDVPASELESLLNVSLPVGSVRTKALFHSRRSPDGGWQVGKAGIEIRPLSSLLLNHLLGRMGLVFDFLLYRGGQRRYAVVGLSAQRRVLYTPLLPELVRRS